jgi:hypothetical protein
MMDATEDGILNQITRELHLESMKCGYPKLDAPDSRRFRSTAAIRTCEERPCWS